MLFFFTNQIDIPYFENGVYSEFALSFLSKGDLNIVNHANKDLEKWAITKTGNHSTFSHSGLATYLVPLYLPLYQYKKSMDIYDYKKITNYMASVVLILTILILYALLRFLKIKHKSTAISLVLLGTPFFWYSFFENTTPDLITNLYLLIVLFYFLISEKAKKNSAVLVGMSMGLGFAIRIHSLWIGTLALMQLIKNKYKYVIVFSASFIGIFCLYLLNSKIRQNFNSHPLFVYFFSSDTTDFILNTYRYGIFGPNGYFTTSPLYILFIFSFALIILRKCSKQNFYFLLALPVFILFLAYHSTWVIVDELAGRLENDYVFIYVILIALLFDFIKNKFFKYYKALSVLAIAMCAWHIYITAIYGYFFTHPEIYSQWQFNYEYANYAAAIQFINYICNKLAVVQFLSYIPYLVVTFATTYLIIKITQSFRSIYLFGKFFIITSLVIYTFITLGNYNNNFKNTEKLRLLGLLSEKVIFSGNSASFYVDLTDEYKKNSIFYILRNDCVSANKIKKIYLNYVETVKNEIVSDPIHFISLLSSDPANSYLTKSNLDDQFFSLQKNCQY